MSEATLGLMVMIFILFSLCGLGFILLCPSQLERFVEWWKKRRAA
ncbi:MAG: hypothetical protein OXU71_11545 [Gammaproteobacteria bacterium]|nr:hypothetical protein [Gammaproteobacteria bacterium]